MRTIKFRGMDIDGNWHYGNLAIVPKNTANHKAGHYISNSAGMPFAYQVRPETVGQYSGYEDINGKEIYEGHVVCRAKDNPFSMKDGTKQYQTWFVEFKYGGWHFTNTAESPAISYPSFYSNAKYMEIIEPELLEVKA